MIKSLHSAFPGSVEVNSRSTTLAYYFFQNIVLQLGKKSLLIRFALCMLLHMVSRFFFFFSLRSFYYFVDCDLLTGVVFQCCKLINFTISPFHLGKESYCGCFCCLTGKSMCFLVHSEIGNCWLQLKLNIMVSCRNAWALSIAERLHRVLLFCSSNLHLFEVLYCVPSSGPLFLNN